MGALCFSLSLSSSIFTGLFYGLHGAFFVFAFFSLNLGASVADSIGLGGAGAHRGFGLCPIVYKFQVLILARGLRLVESLLDLCGRGLHEGIGL